MATLIALAVQFSLGIFVNLCVPVPASDAHASYLQEIKTAPAALTAHVLLGLLLICAAAVLLLRSVRIRDRLMITAAAAGIAAIAGAFAAGEVFVKNGQSSASLAMAVLTGVALVCYVAALGRTGRIPQGN
jgi:hypothetical protein